MIRAFLLFILLPMGAFAQQIINTDGSTLSHPLVTSFDGTTFTVEHDGGIAHVPWEKMPEKLRVGYEFDPARAKAQRERDALKLLNIHKIIEIKTDLPSFAGKQFTIQGTIEVSDYYNWGYRDARATHYAFRIKDGTGYLTAYMPKAKSQELRALLLSDEAVKKEPQTFICTMLPARNERNAFEPMLEILDYGQDTSRLLRTTR